MRNKSRPHTGAVALGVFCMTVLTGIGGTSAYALWEQSSAATMTVRAALPTLLPSPTPTATPTSTATATPTATTTSTATVSPTPAATATATPSTTTAPLTLTCTNAGSGTVDIGIDGASTQATMDIAGKVVGTDSWKSFAFNGSPTKVNLTVSSLSGIGSGARDVVIRIRATSSSSVSVGQYDHVKVHSLLNLGLVSLGLSCGGA